MRIGLFIPNLRIGGAERVACLLTTAWAAAGHEVLLVTYEPPQADDFSTPEGVQRIVLGNAHASHGWATLVKNLRRIVGMRRALRDHRLDVALSFLMETNVCLALAGVGTSTVCVGSERTYPPATPPGWIRGFVRRHAYAALDALVAASQGTADWALKATRARRVQVIANPLQWPLPQRNCTHTPQNSLPGRKRLLLAVGRLDGVKQFDHLLRAFAQVAPQRPHWQLAIVGDGPKRGALEALVASLSLTGRAHLPGASADMPSWYAAADLFALTSSHEGFPNALLEALASGLPAVSYDCLTGPRDLIHVGVNGTLVPPGDEPTLARSLALWMDNDARRLGLRSGGLMLREAHAPARIAAQWLELFRHCQWSNT